MDRQLKNALKEGFKPPAPEKKKEFFHRIPPQSMSTFAFIHSQIWYIRKWNWILFALIFTAALVGAKYMERDVLWQISASMPLLALFVVTERNRSEAYGMAEFELAARFSLKSVVLARLGILGTANFFLFCLLMPFAFMNSETTLLQTGIYILCPYLLTTFLGLLAARKVRGKESLYLCTCIAVSISFTDVLLTQAFPVFAREHYFTWWAAAFILFFIGTLEEFYKTIKQTEELAWNL